MKKVEKKPLPKTFNTDTKIDVDDYANNSSFETKPQRVNQSLPSISNVLKPSQQNQYPLNKMNSYAIAPVIEEENSINGGLSINQTM